MASVFRESVRNGIWGWYDDELAMGLRPRRHQRPGCDLAGVAGSSKRLAPASQTASRSVQHPAIIWVHPPGHRPRITECSDYRSEDRLIRASPTARRLSSKITHHSGSCKARSPACDFVRFRTKPCPVTLICGLRRPVRTAT
jgi:hypothetical protein